MIEIVSRRFKPTDVDQKFMDACEEIDRNPPATWSKYSDMADVITMEYNEMLQAKKSGNMAEYKENLIHLSTALLKEWRRTYD